MIKCPQNWQVFENPEQLAQQAVAQIVECAEQAIAERGAFHLVTAGGTTPNRCYELLAQRDDQAWSNWFIYMGDERVLAADDPERNSQALLQAWLHLNQIPADQIFFMPTELGLNAAVEAYQSQLATAPIFDLVLLGMGEDGHTASLFPGHDNQTKTDSVIAITNSPKPPAERVSLSYPRLNQSRMMLKLISGAGKHAAVQAWLQDQDLPIARLSGEQNRVYLDQSAWSGA